MKVLIGGLYHESNTFNPYITNVEEFVVDEGEKMLGKVASTKVFKEAGVEVVPSVYAFGLPSGIVSKKAYRIFADKILGALEKNPDIDGIWLHLHGSMIVENIGSCELQLLKEIREIVGFEIPISLTLDIHCNNDLSLNKYANIIRTYRSVPHVDQKETEEITAKLLVKSMKNKSLPDPILKRVPMIIPGEAAVDSLEPLKSIFKKLEEIENQEGIMTASFCIGFSWADTKNTSSSVIVIPESEKYREYALEVTNTLIEYIFEKRDDFDFSSVAFRTEDAIIEALSSDEKPIFISDSGDNTTGGGVGSSTYFLEKIIEKKILIEEKNKRICIAAIYDEEAYSYCSKKKLGEEIDLLVGTGEYKLSKPISIKGTLKSKGNLMGYLGFTDVKVGDVYTISLGNIDIVIANKAYSFITGNHFFEANLDLDEYDIIVIKQGYMFADIEKISQLHILGLSPGATYQEIEKLKYEKIPRPVYPFDTITAIN